METVQSCDDMDDDTVYKHLNARHLEDLGMNAPMQYSEEFSETLVLTMRNYHERVHAIATPTQHDHHHLDSEA